jgi:hypothetical protein
MRGRDFRFGLGGIRASRSVAAAPPYLVSGKRCIFIDVAPRRAIIVRDLAKRSPQLRDPHPTAFGGHLLPQGEKETSRL